MAVFLPSLVYGILWDRYKSVLPCWIVHAAYNLAYFNPTF
jgi:membrane protease YdiL (CAAX protease family)